MSIALRSTSSVTGQTGSTFTVPAPAGIQDGDKLIAFQLNSNSSAPSGPSGFTAPVNYTIAFGSLGGPPTLSVFYKTAASESGSYTFDNVVGTDTSDVWLLCFSGVQSGGSFTVTNNSGSGTTLTATGVSVPGAGYLILCGFADATNQTITPGGSLTDIGTIGSMLLGSLDAAYLIKGSSGATGNQTATVSGSITWGSILIAFSPASAPVVEEMPWHKAHPTPDQIVDYAQSRSLIGSWINTLKTFNQPPWKCNPLYSEVVFVDGQVSRYQLPWYVPPVPNIDRIPWRRKLDHQSEPEIEVFTRSKTLLPLPLQTQILTSQEGRYGIFNTILLPSQCGIYRIQNDIEGYNAYIGAGGLPDLTTPSAFSKTLPFQIALTPPISGTLTYYILVRSQDSYGLVSQNSFYSTITIDSTGGLYLPPIPPPQDLLLFNEASGFVHILAAYPTAGSDPYPCDFWKIWVGTSLPDPSTDPTVAMPAVSGNILATDIGPYSSGLLYVMIALYRTTDGFQTSTIYSTITIPTAPPEVQAIPSGFDIQP